MLALILIQAVQGKYYLMLVREEFLKKGHIKFIDDIDEGLIVCSTDLTKVVIFNQAAQNLLLLQGQHQMVGY